MNHERAPRRIAATTFAGIPRENGGIRDPLVAALLAASGPATPSMVPLPNRSGCLESFFSIARERKVAVIAPARGDDPEKEAEGYGSYDRHSGITANITTKQTIPMILLAL